MIAPCTFFLSRSYSTVWSADGSWHSVIQWDWQRKNATKFLSLLSVWFFPSKFKFSAAPVLLLSIQNSLVVGNPKHFPCEFNCPSCINKWVLKISYRILLSVRRPCTRYVLLPLLVRLLNQVVQRTYFVPAYANDVDARMLYKWIDEYSCISTNVDIDMDMDIIVTINIRICI